MALDIVNEIMQFNPVERLDQDGVALGRDALTGQYVVSYVPHHGEEHTIARWPTLKAAMVDFTYRIQEDVQYVLNG
jgi:hypothetical protein